MKKTNYLLLIIICMAAGALAQSDFSVSAYLDYVNDHENMSGQSLQNEFALQNTYYKELGNRQPVTAAAYLDSMTLKYDLTPDELKLLNKNHFVVTERLSFNIIGQAFHDVYGKDMPVFVSSDAILYALHASYDRILIDLEFEILKPALQDMLSSMQRNISDLQDKYPQPGLEQALADVDLYVTMALSLLNEEKVATSTGLVENFDQVWGYIQDEQVASLPLFSERERDIDFSQFTVRGHYAKHYWYGGEPQTLASYFKAMMWLGRIDFWLTAPPENPWQTTWTWQEIQRMAQATLLMNELMDMTNAWPLMQDIEKVLTFFVGESDNLTPIQLSQVMTDNNISLASIADSSGLADFQRVLTASDDYLQKILSAIIMMDPYSDEPGVLPVSYKLMGQRFVLDSYILGNVVYDHIIHNGAKVWRPLPDPMDAMFVLGNDNTLPLLQQELDTYHYSQNLAGLRYLVDSYDDDYWELSLYNTWLSAIRELNPNQDLSESPLFMQSAAWQHKELNTQLASWAHLRHDNLLYAKQSYTGPSLCSYPHSFVEPCPGFYRAIQRFAENANSFFASYQNVSYIFENITNYFQQLETTVAKLEELAEKELEREAFSEQDVEFLQQMLFEGGDSGQPPFTGWFASLFYAQNDAAQEDHVIADIHTQPTDEFGAPVGHVLHVGVGKFNMGFFMAPSPSSNFAPMVYAGPVMSYYEKTTSNFERLTDEEWAQNVTDGQVPARPDWVNIYLADKNGVKRQQGREVPASTMTGTDSDDNAVPSVFRLSDNYPNPFNPETIIEYELSNTGKVTLAVYDLRGRQVAKLVSKVQSKGVHRVSWNAENIPSGVYFYQLQSGVNRITKKMTILK